MSAHRSRRILLLSVRGQFSDNDTPFHRGRRGRVCRPGQRRRARAAGPHDRAGRDRSVAIGRAAGRPGPVQRAGRPGGVQRCARVGRTEGPRRHGPRDLGDHRHLRRHADRRPRPRQHERRRVGAWPRSGRFRRGRSRSSGARRRSEPASDSCATATSPTCRASSRSPSSSPREPRCATSTRRIAS